MILSTILFSVSAFGLLWIYFFMKRRELRGVVRGDIPMPDELYRFLEYADDGYMLAHETNHIEHFSPYASPAVCHDVLERMRQYSPKLFGTPSHRIRTWRVDKAGEGYYLIGKHIAHRAVSAGYGVRIALGDVMEETWRVSVIPGGYRVEDVK